MKERIFTYIKEVYAFKSKTCTITSECHAAGTQQLITGYASLINGDLGKEWSRSWCLNVMASKRLPAVIWMLIKIKLDQISTSFHFCIKVTVSQAISSIGLTAYMKKISLGQVIFFLAGKPKALHYKVSKNPALEAENEQHLRYSFLKKLLNSAQPVSIYTKFSLQFL